MGRTTEGKDKTKDALALEMHNALVKDCFKFLNKKRNKVEDEIFFNRVSVAALIKVASIVAVDSGLDVVKFAKICELNYTEANQHAPRWA